MDNRKRQEQIVLAQWLRGEYLSDMDKISYRDFRFYPKVVGYILQNGLDAFRKNVFAEELLSKEEYAEVYSQNFESLYAVNFKAILDKHLHDFVEQNPGATAQEILKQAELAANHISDIPKPMKDPVTELIADFDRRAATKLITTGITQLDNLLWGIRSGELTFVGARPSVGKSAFLLQMAETVALQGKKVLYLSLEMSEISMWSRLLLRRVYIPQHILRKGLNKDYWQKPEVSEAIDSLHRLAMGGNFILIPNARDLSVIKELVKTHEPYMLLIDQLQQMDDKSKYFKDVRSRFSHMTRELQNIALGEDIAVWCACQINRSADDSVPTMANLKEAGNIEEDATNVILLHREGDRTERQDIRCELAKQKEGACGDFMLSFHAPQFTFTGTAPI